MAIITLYYKYAKEYEEKGYIRILKPHNAKKDFDLVEATTEGILMCSRRSGKTKELKELIGRCKNGKESIKRNFSNGQKRIKKSC